MFLRSHLMALYNRTSESFADSLAEWFAVCYMPSCCMHTLLKTLQKTLAVCIWREADINEEDERRRG